MPPFLKTKIKNIKGKVTYVGKYGNVDQDSLRQGIVASGLSPVKKVEPAALNSEFDWK